MNANLEDPKKETPEEEETEKSKLTETLETLKKNENIESFMNYAKTNTRDTIAYALMVVGIIWMFFQGFYGGILVGLVTGFYFSKEVIQVIKNFNQFVEEQGIARSLVLGGTTLALFIMAPGIVIGCAIMVGLKVMLRLD